MDLKIAYLQDVVDVEKADILSTTPPKVEVVGDDFRNVSHVIINGERTTEFIIVSRRKLVAVIPEAQRDQVIRDIVVVSGAFTATKRSVVSFEVGMTPQLIEGLQRLMQRFVLLLFRNPGSDILNPESGGGFGKLAKQFMEGRDTVTASDVALAVSRTTRQLLKYQSGNSRLRDSERLGMAELLGVEHSEISGTLSPRIRITSQAGRTGILAVQG